MLINDLKKEFEYITKIEPSDFVAILKDVDVEIIALVLTQLPNENTVSIIRNFENSKRAIIISQLTNLVQIKNNDLLKISKYIKDKVDKYFNVSKFDGLNYTIKILNMTGNDSVDILNELEQLDSTTADKLKNRIGTLEDILKLDPSGRMNLMGNIETDVLALAFFKSSDNDKEILYEAMSKRGKDRFKEEMDLIGNPYDGKIYEAIAKVMDVFYRLVEEGQIEP